jgi:hypothetical protein
MTASTVYALNQRVYLMPDSYRELGMFTDKSMVEQAIDACYRQAYKQMMSPKYMPDTYLPLFLRDHLRDVGFERWVIDDKNATYPIFFWKKHLLWNQVPSDMTDFAFTLKEE